MKKKLFTLLTLALAVCSGAWAQETVNVTWFPSSMTSATFTTAGTADVEGLLTVNKVTHSTPVSDPVFRNKNSENWAKFTSSNVNVNGSNKNRWLATDYVIFSVDIVDGVTFTPTKVTATVAGSGTSGCNAGLFNSIQTTAQSGQSSGIAQEQDGGKKYELTSFAKTTYNGGETLSFYIHIGIPSGKGISINNVTLTGTYTQGAQSKYTKPIITEGAYSQADGTYAVTLAVQNSEDGTINYTVGGAAEVIGVASGTVINVAPETTITAYVTGSTYSNSDNSTLTTSAQPTLAMPTYSIGSYDLMKNIYSVSLSAAAGDIIYTIGGSSSVYSDALQLAPETAVEAYATQANMTNSAILSFTVPAAPTGGSASSSTTSGTYSSNVSYNMGAITIPGACIAGQISSGSTPINNSIKTRCNQVLSDSKVGFYVNVNQGYIVTGIKIVGCSNATDANTCTSVYVDGVAVDGFSAVSLPLAEKSGSTGTIEVTGINATNKIEFAFENTYQAQMNITVTYGVSASSTLAGVSGFNKAFATFCAPNNFTISGDAKAYKAAVSGDKIVMTEIEGVIPALTGVIIAGNDAASYNITFVSEDASADVTGNELLGVTVRTLTSTLAGSGTLLALNSSAAEYQTYNGTYFPSNKAYLMVSSGARSLKIAFADETTAINAIEDIAKNGTARKYLRDGKLVIETAKGVFSVQGTQMK